MSGEVPDHIRELLAQSCAAWHLVGDIDRLPDGALLLGAAGKRLRIWRAPANLPFRWMVSEGERTRGVTGIAGLLRTVRSAFDPSHRPIRLRIAPLPIAPE